VSANPQDIAAYYLIPPGGQRETTVLSPAGTGFDRVIEVTYKIIAGPAAGTVGTVQVPEETYTVDTVREAVEVAVARRQQVASLGSPS